MSNFADTRVIEAKYEAIFGAHLYSMVKSHIAVILRKNSFPVSYEDFVFRVVLTKTTEREEDVELDIVRDGVVDEKETEELRVGMQRDMVMGECVVEHDGQYIPRLVFVQYAQDYSIKPEFGNMYAPVSSSFEQRGMVIDLETGEVLCPGISWVKTVDDIQVFEDIYKDELHRPHLQLPIEGANITVFQDPRDKVIYICTGHRIMRVEDILNNAGSKWNFYGRGFEGNSKGVLQFNQGERTMDIHLAALECIANAALDYMGVTEIPEKNEQIPEFVCSSIRKVLFEKAGNLVVTGIISGNAFAGRSLRLTAEDYDRVTFSPTAYLERNLLESGRTQWVQEADEKPLEWARLDRVFSSVSLDIDAIFGVTTTPLEYMKTHIGSIWFNHLFSPKEDLLIVQYVRENGSRGMFRLRTQEAVFRDAVVRGTNEEIEEVKAFFPKHRSRNYGTAATIEERVKQVITLSISGKQNYAFQSVDVLGSMGAKIFGGYVKTAVAKLLPRESLGHWMDVAFPISDFSIKTSEMNEVKVPRMLVSPANRKVCNGLAVLYACTSPCLKDKVVEATAEFFATRAAIAAVAFLPPSAFSKIELEYLKEHPGKDGHLPVGIHKLRTLRTNAEQGTMTASQRKYKIAGYLSRNTVLDIQFMKSVCC